MRIIFAGTPQFSVTTLEALINADHQVICVYTQPDRKTGRGQKLTPPPVKQCANQHNIEVRQPLSLKSNAEIAALKNLNADIMVVVAYGLLLPQPILDAPIKGCLNIHASLLPKWRGAAPIQRCIEAGDKFTGVSIMQMDAGLDTGDVLYKSEIAIAEDDNSAKMHDKLATLGATALLKCLEKLEQYQQQAEQQNHSDASYAHKISKQEANIDWHQSAHEIHNKIRAFNPWPVCQTYLSLPPENHLRRLRVWATQLIENEHNYPAGEIIELDKTGIYVACGKHVIKLIEVQPDGSKRMPAIDFINGHQLTTDLLFTEQQPKD